MSIADKITSMTNHLEKDYQALESVVGTVSVNKNIENIAPLLDNLWEELPKVTGSGTSPSISDTRAGKMKLYLSGNTGQDGTPTPDAPQTIHNVNGDNTIITTGKNQIGLKSLSSTIISGLTCSVDGDVLTINGTATAKADIQKLLFNLTANTTKTLKFYLESGTFTAGNIGIHLNENEESGQVSFIQIPYDTASLKSTKTISLTNVNYVWVYATSGSVFNNAKFKIMLSDDVNDDYEPYQISSYPINLPVENLLNLSTLDNAGGSALTTEVGTDYIKLTQSGSSSWQYRKFMTDLDINKYKGKTITISGISSNNTNIKIALYNSSKNLIDDLYTTLVIPSDTTASYIGIQLYQSNGTGISGTTTFTNLQLEVGTKANTYTPYGTTPIELNKISTYKDGFIINSGKNKLPLSANDLTFNAYISNTGEYTTTTTGNYYASAEYIDFNYAGEEMTLSTGLEIAFYNSDKTFISYKTRNDNRTQIIPNNTAYIRIDCYKDNINEMMINLGSTALPYEPYGSGEWYLRQEIGSITLNGTENWTYRNDYSAFYINNTTSLGTIAPLSNYFKGITSGITSNDKAILFNTSTLFLLYHDLNGDTDALKTWLSNNNVTVDYVKATPTYTKITDSTLLEQLNAVYRAYTYNTQTNFTQINNDLPFNLDATALEG